MTRHDFKCRLGRLLRIGSTHALYAICALALLSLACMPARAAPASPQTAAATAGSMADCHADCVPRIGIVSAFGAEADLLLAALSARADYSVNGNRFSTGLLEGEPVVVVLCGVSMVNAAMVTQLMIDRFDIARVVLSGIAGGIDPGDHVGDVVVPERWALPLEAWWGPDGTLPAPCGTPGRLDCLGLRLLQDMRPGSGIPPALSLPWPPRADGAAQDTRPSGDTGLRMRATFVRSAATGADGEFRATFPVDQAMLAVARGLAPQLQRCGPRAPGLCISDQPQVRVGGTGVTVPVFLANPDYRRYLFDTLQARVLDMETAAVAQTAYANARPFLALRSVSDLAGGGPNADVGALFSSGLAESNSARVTLAFLAAWHAASQSASSASGRISDTAGGAPSTPADAARGTPRAVKVLIVTMFAPEAEPWLKPFALDTRVPVAGLPAEYPELRCNPDDVCLLTTGMGHANAAASMMAVALAPQLDLSKTWFLVAGIAGIDPARGTLGTAAWARFLVDSGLTQALDPREMPAGWPDGAIGVMTAGPGIMPRMEYHTELYELDPALVAKAMRLSEGVHLADSPAAQRYRARYREAAARAAPRVTQCDTLAGDTWWHGRYPGLQARRWTRLLTQGRGNYCTTQQEDNATAAALMRGARAGRLDARRLAVLRTGVNFDRQHAGQSAYASLRADAGAFAPALENLYRAGGVVVRDIVAHWDQWSVGVPP